MPTATTHDGPPHGAPALSRSLSVRLTAMFAACAAVVFLIAGVVLYQVLNEGVSRLVRGELLLRAAWVESEVARVQNEAQWRLWLSPKLRAAELERSATALWILSTDANFRYGAPGDDATALARTGGFGTLVQPGHPCLLVTLARTVPGDGDRPPVTFLLAKDPLRFVEMLELFRVALLVAGVLGVAGVAALGLFMARVGLRPLRRLSTQAAALDPNRQAQRLSLDPMPAELQELTASFNGALERLEAAYRQLEAFNADVAHELRTPLSNLIGQTQVLLSRRRDAAALTETMHSNLEELERLKAIVNDMLFLARADQGAAAAQGDEVALADEVAKVIDFLDPLIEERGVRVVVQGDARGRAETALLQRALGNLLVNAIEHGAPGDEITVTVTQREGEVAVAVSNPGATIDERHLARLFDRFYRVDSARRNGQGGNHGLGLAIVKAIATMHRGTVFARSEQGRNVFGFTLASR